MSKILIFILTFLFCELYFRNGAFVSMNCYDVSQAFRIFRVPYKIFVLSLCIVFPFIKYFQSMYRNTECISLYCQNNVNTIPVFCFVSLSTRIVAPILSVNILSVLMLCACLLMSDLEKLYGKSIPVPGSGGPYGW
jgi:hypothetical protein